MSKQFSLTSETKIVQVLPPAADAAGRVSAYVSLKGAHKAYVVASLNQGNAAPVPVSLLQAKDLVGTGAKPVATAFVHANEDTSASDTLASVGYAPNYSTSATVKPKQVVFSIVPELALDTANGYSCIAVVTGASNAANITEATAILGPLRYSQSVPPSAIA